MRLRIALLLMALSVGASAQSTLVEAQTPAVSASGVLVQDVGIETLGGVFTAIVKQGCRVPCSSTQVFSTGEDRQSEVKLFLFRGKAKLVKDAKRLGVFAVVGIPEMPRGTPQIAVTFAVQ